MTFSRLVFIDLKEKRKENLYRSFCVTYIREGCFQEPKLEREEECEVFRFINTTSEHNKRFKEQHTLHADVLSPTEQNILNQAEK